MTTRKETFKKRVVLAPSMKARIAHFRQNRHTTYGNQMIITVQGISSREEAQKLVGKTITYDTGKKEIQGEVRSAHGNSGALRVLFETGMPGQALGQEVKLS